MTGQPEMDWQSDVRRAFEGFTEALAAFAVKAEAQKRREGEEGYLSYATARECAAVEYAWRGHHQGMCDAYTTVAARVGEWMGRAHAAEAEVAREVGRNGELAGKVESLRGELARSRAEHAVDVETLGRERERADRIRDANLRLCALRDANRSEKDADVVPTSGDTGLLTTRQKGSEISDVFRPGTGRNMGRVVPDTHGWWKAYVYRARGPEEFVGWYDNVDKAARAVDREYGR